MKIKLQGLVGFGSLVLFLPLFVGPGCSDSPPKVVQQQGESKETTVRNNKPGSSFTDTVKINSPAAVFYSPDSLQLEKLRVITDTIIYESTMHDCFYQMRNSRRILERDYKNVRIIEVKNARYLVFKKINGEKEYLDLNTQNDPCGLFIFDTRKSRKLVDMTNVET